MAIDTEYISDKDFNSKFKNYLRDFYVFQFKNKDVDFYKKGTFLKSRMISVSILSFISGKSLEELLYLRMKDIVIERDFVSVCLKNDNGYTLNKPLSEMFKYLYTPEKTAYFLTGNTGAPKLEKLKAEYDSFCRSCTPPKTIEKMYRYWGQVYLEEANESIKNSTYRNDSLRIQALVEKMAGVTWKHGQKPNYQTNSLANETDSCVECITIDTRTLKENPFHLLYNYCNRYSSNDESSRGEHFLLIYALILYFNLGIKINNSIIRELNESQIKKLNELLFDLAVYLESEDRRHPMSKWENLSDEDKLLYAYNAVECFMEAKGNVDRQVGHNYEYIYSYLVENKKRIVYKNGSFIIENDTETCIDVNILYDFFSSFVNQEYSIQRRQFLNVMKYLVKIGLFEEKKELKLKLKRKKDYSVSLSAQIEEILNEINCFDFELIEKVEKRVYVLRYDSNMNIDTVIALKKKIKEKCKGWECKSDNSIYYYLSTVCLSDILAGNSELKARFSDMISFFSQTAALGEIGSFISKHLPAAETPIYYKHNYIIRGLNDYNLSDLLYSIKKKKWIDIECRSPINEQQYQHFICFPIMLKENVSTGKQTLIYYHPDYRSIASVDLNDIDSISVGEYDKEYYNKKYYFDADIKRAQRLIQYTWGDNFYGFFEGNVKADIKPSKLKFVVAFNKNKEKFIRYRIRKEVPNGQFTEYYPGENVVHAEIVAEVINPMDMLQWIRSYTTRIVSIEVLYNGFVDEVMRSYKMYQLPAQQDISMALSTQKTDVIETVDTDFQAEENMHDQLFNEFYSVSFSKLGDILFDILQCEELNDEFIELKKQDYLNIFTFDNSKKIKENNSKSLKNIKEKREAQVDSFIKNFVSNNTPIFSTVKEYKCDSIRDFIPLTKIENQWLNNILEHPFAHCFLTVEEIEYLKEKFTDIGLFNINDDIVLTNQAEDVKKFYKKRHYADNLRMIIKAIREKNRVNICGITQRGSSKNYINFAPSYIEYSKKDDRFRIRGVCNKKRIDTINLERIVSVSFTNETFNQRKIAKTVSKDDKNKEKHLVLFFNDVDNVPGKILSEFSCFKKECSRWGNGKFTMVLYYNNNDYKEIIIRLLGYGSLITVFEDTGSVLSELKERLESQLVLSNMLNISRTIEKPETEREA